MIFHEKKYSLKITMKLGMQLVPIDEVKRKRNIQELRDFKYQASKTHMKKKEQLVPMLWAHKEAFYLMGNTMIEVFTEKELENAGKRLIYEQNGKIQSTVKIRYFGKTTNFIMDGMKKQTSKVLRIETELFKAWWILVSVNLLVVRVWADETGGWGGRPSMY